MHASAEKAYPTSHHHRHCHLTVNKLKKRPCCHTRKVTLYKATETSMHHFITRTVMATGGACQRHQHTDKRHSQTDLWQPVSQQHQHTDRDTVRQTSGSQSLSDINILTETQSDRPLAASLSATSTYWQRRSQTDLWQPVSPAVIYRRDRWTRSSSARRPALRCQCSCLSHPQTQAAAAAAHTRGSSHHHCNIKQCTIRCHTHRHGHSTYTTYCYNYNETRAHNLHNVLLQLQWLQHHLMKQHMTSGQLYC